MILLGRILCCSVVLGVIALGGPGAALRPSGREVEPCRLGKTLTRSFTMRSMPLIVWVSVLVAEKARQMALGSVFASATEAERDLRRVLYLPRFRVPITAALVKDDGSVWLRREDATGSVQFWHVLGRNGEVAATVSTPKGLSIRQIEDDYVWGVESDDLGVPYLVRFRVQGAPR